MLTKFVNWLNQPYRYAEPELSLICLIFALLVGVSVVFAVFNPSWEPLVFTFSLFTAIGNFLSAVIETKAKTQLSSMIWLGFGIFTLNTLAWFFLISL